MSSNIVDILRNRFNFSGLLLSDDLEMGAVANNQGPVKAAMAAILAGHDLILVCRERRLVKETHQGLMEALSSRQLPAERTRGALDRLAKLLDHLGQP
jgi:beta-N-acetylhexosaminidase